MKKKIEDYLHLYCGGGCRCICTSEHPEQTRELDEHILLGYRGEYHLIKPILRQLSSMTEEEFNESPLLDSYKEAVRNLSLQYQPSLHGETGKDIPEEEAMKKVRMTWAQYMVIVAFPPIKVTSETFKYLLSKSFDLFGLHEAGLCVYESDLKTTTL